MVQQLILASQSPRRKELLTQLGYQFTSCAANIDESQQVNESPADYVRRLAQEKAQFIAKNQPDTTIVLGSDTSVVFQGEILTKPVDFADSQQMLGKLSNNTHQVLTAVALVKGHESETVLVSTDVTFKALSEQEIKRYWQTGEPQDKAGSYGIQGIAGQFVSKLNGSYSAVVGLPLYETSQLLAKFGMPSSISQ